MILPPEWRRRGNSSLC